MPSLIKFLFPDKTLKQQLPLLPRVYSSVYGESVPPQLERDVKLLKGNDHAKTDADAMRILRQHPDKTISELLVLLEKKRRHLTRWQMFKSRCHQLWSGRPATSDRRNRRTRTIEPRRKYSQKGLMK